MQPQESFGQLAFTVQVYDKGLIVALIRILRSVLSRPTSSGTLPQAYIASTVRNPATLGYFLTELAASGIAVEDITAQAATRHRLFEYAAHQAILLHRLTVQNVNVK